ncbi:MAG: inositol monophosphatase [Patescibacteria group bacterium]
MEEKYQKIIAAARAGGQVLKHYFGQELEVTEKTMPSDFVTIADLEAEAAVLKILKENFPDYNIISEESDDIANGSEYTFIIDPMDGTNNFILGLANFSCTIALMKNKEVIFSVVYNPIIDKLYYAIKGQGAFLNDKKINVNSETDLRRASISFIAKYNHDENFRLKIIENLKTSNIIKRYMENWSPLLDFSMLAAGKIEVVISSDSELHDILAGKLIAKEAGAIILSLDGNLETDDRNTSFICANNKVIANKILEIIK